MKPNTLNPRIRTILAAAALALILACGKQDTQVKDMAQKAEQAQATQSQVQQAGQKQEQQLKTKHSHMDQIHKLALEHLQIR